MTPPPTLVVGGGPAGSVTALLLARAGRSVVLVDRSEFPRAKACGECANPGTVEQLRELGLADRVGLQSPGRLEGWVLRGPDGRTWRTPFPRDVHAWTVDRTSFDHALLQAAADAGVDVRTGVAFEGLDRLEPSGGRARVRRRGAAGSSSIPFDRLVGADGLHSRVRSALHLDAVGPTRKAGVAMHVRRVDAAPGWGHLDLDREVTVGLAPLDPQGDRWTLVLVARRGTRLPTRPGEVIAAAARRVPGLASATPESPILGCGPFDRPVSTPWRPGAVLVGDAAGYFDPVTGQGIGRAIGSARLAAEALLAGGDPRDLATFARRLGSARRGGLRVQRLIDRVLQRPTLLARLLPALERSGALRDLVAVTGDHLPVGALLDPARWLAWTRCAIIPSTPSPTPSAMNSCAP
jgi:flavin-dependent dehydrogenase